VNEKYSVKKIIHEAKSFFIHFFFNECAIIKANIKMPRIKNVNRYGSEKRTNTLIYTSEPKNEIKKFFILLS